MHDGRRPALYTPAFADRVLQMSILSERTQAEMRRKL